MKRNIFFKLVSITLFLCSTIAFADIVVPMYLVTDDGSQQQSIGTVTFAKAKCGVLLTPNLNSLPPGIHGFHIHENASCADKAMAAGGHFDPKKTNAHLGPYRNGHQGDLPVLVVDAKGQATLPVLAPDIAYGSLKHHALIIHAGSDNYADQPEKLGGGGARIACGLIS